MNSVRKAIKGQEGEMRKVLEKAYTAIAKYQRTRKELHEHEVWSAIDLASEFCSRFKPLIPPYKRRYFEILENAERLQLSTRDLIMTFDRAIYELHTRMERSQKERDALGPWSKKVLEILDGRRAVPGVSSGGADAYDGGELVFITSGRTVVAGRRVGPVRVVQSDADYKEVREGEIVACRMTSPELVMAVDNVAGVVTEQGGSLCHAAILAREFGIPCVVGCGSFLAEVTSGETVVLDASSGILLRPKNRFTS